MLAEHGVGWLFLTGFFFESCLVGGVLIFGEVGVSRVVLRLCDTEHFSMRLPVSVRLDAEVIVGDGLLANITSSHKTVHRAPPASSWQLGFWELGFNSSYPSAKGLTCHFFIASTL